MHERAQRDAQTVTKGAVRLKRVLEDFHDIITKTFKGVNYGFP